MAQRESNARAIRAPAVRFRKDAAGRGVPRRPSLRARGTRNARAHAGGRRAFSLTGRCGSPRLGRMRPLLLGIALLLLAGSALAEESAPPRIYRWVDENGIAHYTTDPERIPASLRRRFGLPAEPLRRAPLDAHAPAPEAAPEAWAGQEKGEAPVAAEPAPPAGESGGEWREAAPADVAAAGPAAHDRLAQLELRIAELSASIAADEDALSAWIGDPAAGDPIEVGAKPEFREIAQRLPKRIQELEALQRERDALATAVP